MNKIIDRLKSIWNKIRSRCYARMFVFKKDVKSLLNDLDKPSSFYNDMILIRAGEFQRTGSRENIITGDSIIHIGESYFEKCGIKNLHCTAIAGDTTDFFISRIVKNILIFNPKRLAFHLSGNDFLAGKSVDHIFNNLYKIITVFKKSGIKNVGWIEPIPLADPKTSSCSSLRKKEDYINSVNFELIPELINRMHDVSEELNFDIIHIRESLQKSDGYISDRYRLPDAIHVNAGAYREVLVPKLKIWYIEKGANLL